MRNLVFYVAFIAAGLLQAQEQKDTIVKGDILILSQPLGSSYFHIEFPKKNIIIKRGAIANFNNLIGQKLVVDQIILFEDGTTEAILKRKDGKNFFRFFPKVKSNLDKAVATGELKIPKRKNQIAKN